MKKLAILIIGIIELLFLKQWLACVRFGDHFHFSALDLKLRLIEAVHNDSGVPISIVRAFHNKIVGTLIDIFNNYTQYWSIAFLVNLLSFVGAFGLICSIWYLFQKRYDKWVWALFAAALIFPLIEILATYNSPFVFQLGLITIPLVALSFVGWREFLAGKSKFRYVVFAILVTLSLIWLFSTHASLDASICVK